MPANYTTEVREMEAKHLAGKWTARTVREYLPPVSVQLQDGRKVICAVGGRLLPFAGVHINGASVEVSWETLARLLNTGKSLLLS